MLLEPQSLTEGLMYSTVKITSTFRDGRVSDGTGFYFLFKRGTDWSPMIVSNKHVLMDCEQVSFHVHLGKYENGKNRPIGRSMTVATQNDGNLVFPHPNPDIDLCAISSVNLTEQMRTQGRIIFAQYLSPDDIPTDGELRNMAAAEDVLMVGYPNSLWDAVNNFPLFRRGITASHPAVDFNGKCETVVDMAFFPGSSGSPIIWAGSEMKLLGVLYAGPMINAQGNIEIRTIPTARVPVSITPMMMHLGYIIKAREVAALGDAFFKFFDDSQAVQSSKDGISAPDEVPRSARGAPRPPRSPRRQRHKRK